MKDEKNEPTAVTPKACPCGGRAAVFTEKDYRGKPIYVVRCTGCWRASMRSHSKETAIKHWNAYGGY